MLDTGSQVSTVSEESYYRHLQALCKIREGPTLFRMSAAIGTDIPYSGFIVADLKVQNQTVERAILFVVKKIPIGSRPILIGMNVLQHLPMFKNFLGSSHEESVGYA